MSSRGRSRSRRLVVGLVAAVLAVGCAGAPSPGVPSPLATPAPSAAPLPYPGELRVPPASDPAAAADRELAARVERALAADPTLRDAVIEAAAESGRVTLMGTVPTYLERAHAIEVALRVPGVKSVRPRLVLQSP